MMKKLIVFLLIGILFIPAVIIASPEWIEIFQTDGNNIIIEKGINQGIEVNSYYLVVQDDYIIAHAKVLDARDNISALKIISNEFNYAVYAGDWVILDTTNTAAAEDLLSQFNNNLESNKNIILSNPYDTHKKIGGYGALASYGLTVLVAGLMRDYATTAIPIIGPLISVIRVESNPFVNFYTGGKELLILSSVVQASFTTYYLIALTKSLQWESNSSFSIAPSTNSIGITLNYKF
ncbi:MAG: hypothetical protein WCT23_07015 [Candidatus Neomarinimicrobiota bacterium]